MNDKMQIAAQVLALGEDSAQLKMVADIVQGREMPKEEKYLTLRAVAAEVGLHPTWLHRLRVRDECGRQIAGRHRYTKEGVMEYLSTDRCRKRVRELSEERKQKIKKSEGEKI